MDLSLRLLGDSANAQAAFKEFGTAALAAGKILKDFHDEAIRKFAESDRQLRQLRAAAGQYTDALSEQAEVLKRKNAVDDDEIRHMETLLLRYGAAPGVIKDTIQATLDYSAATGKDAVGALEMLIRGVESGSGSLGRMGVHFRETGKFSGDLKNAVDELGKKFGGAGETDAQSLAGRMRASELAVDDVKKAFGGLFATIENKTHTLETFAKTMDRIAGGVNEGGWGGFFHALGLNSRADLDALANPDQQSAIRGTAPGIHLGAATGGLPLTTPADHDVGKEKKDKDDDFKWGPWGNPETSFSAWEDAYKADAQKQQHDIYEEDLKLAAQADKAATEEEKADEKHDEDMLKAHRAVADLELEIQAEKDRKLLAAQVKADAEALRRMKEQEKKWAEAGDRLGASLVNAIGTQLNRLAEGGDVDPAEMAGDIASTILSIAGAAVGSYFGSPQLGSAIGGLAGGLVKTGITAGFGKKHHDGGWIERFHGGGWPMGADEVPAILQAGERVLSRREVGAMGGPAGVESAARGRGGGMVVNISTMDSQSLTESFGRSGGRGLFNAIRVGRGEVAPLFRG